MADVSIGSVSLGMQLDKADLLSQMKDITQSAASVLQNGLSNALRMGNGKVDMSGVIGGIGEVKTEVKALSTMIGAVIEKGMNTGAKDGVAAVTAAVSTVKMPTVKVTATKGDLTNQLDNMVALLDNTNAQIYTQQQMVDELKRRWAGMGNLGQQDSDAGLAMKQSILKAEAALTSLENKSDTVAMKTRAMESAITAFGTEGKQAVQKVAAAATLADKKLDIVGNSGNTSGKKIASGMNSASKSVKSLSLSALSATGLEKRLSSIERNVEKTTRSVTALGRRFMVLFVGKIISAAFKDITASLTGASEKSDTLKNSLNALTSAGRTISNAVVTAIAPLINIVAPALGNVSEMIRVFSNRVAMFFAFISGQDTVLQAKKSFAEYGDAASGAGDAAEKAQKQMAGFDNLNILPSATTASSGGSGSSDGTNADDFETVATQGSDLATKVKKAIDDMLPQITAFWEDVLKPLGVWTLSTGLPMLADGLGNIAQFFKDYPELIDNLAVFLATIVPLSALGPVAVVLGIAVQATIAAIEWYGGVDVSKLFMDALSGKMKEDWDASGATIGGWFVDAIQHGFIQDDTWTDGSYGDQLEHLMMKAFNTDTAYGLDVLKEIGTNLGIGLLNGLVDVLNYGWEPIATIINQMLEQFGQAPLPVKIPPIDYKDYYDSMVAAEISTKKSSRTIDDYYAAIPIAAGKSMDETGTVVKTGTRDQSRTYEDYLYGLTTKTDTTYETVKTTVDLGTKDAARYMNNNLGGGIQGVKDSFGGMPNAVNTEMNNMNSAVWGGSTTASNLLSGNIGGGVRSVIDSFLHMPNAVNTEMNNMNSAVWGGSTTAHSLLTSNIGGGVDTSIDHLGRLSNNGSTRIETFADNVRIAMEAVLRNMSKLPTTAAGARGFSGLTSGFLEEIHNLPMFAQGGYVGANSPQLAIIGDNKTQGEIVTPENAMAEAVAKGIAASGGGGGGDQTIITNVYLDSGELVGTITKKIKRKERQANKPAFA